jgi:CSLREA domain-containing protein
MSSLTRQSAFIVYRFGRAFFHIRRQASGDDHAEDMTALVAGTSPSPGAACVSHEEKENAMKNWYSTILGTLCATLLASAATAQPFTVTKTADTDDGVCDADCSLREAITALNAVPGGAIYEIGFNIPSSDPGCAGGICTIQIATHLPDVVRSVNLDATTQPGYVDHPVIVLNGSLTGEPDWGEEGTDALRIQGGSSSVRGFAFVGFPAGWAEYRSGIRLTSDENVVAGNYFGVLPDGVTPFGVAVGVGIFESSSNVIGGTSPIDRNVFGRTEVYGVYVADSNDNRILGNYFGLGADGTIPMPSEHGDAIKITGWASSNVIGGHDPGARNVINTRGAGIVLYRASSTEILGNYISADASAVVNGTGSDIWGERAGILQSPFSALDEATGTLIDGNVIAGFQGLGVEATTGSIIQNNLIGVSADCSNVIGNGGYGIVAGRGWGIQIHDNVVAGNGEGGILVHAPEVSIWNNHIGTLCDGVTAAGNGGDGIVIAVGPEDPWEETRPPSWTAIGTNNLEVANTIGYNAGSGIATISGSTGTYVRWNYFMNNGGPGIEYRPMEGQPPTDDLPSPILDSATHDGAVLTVQYRLSADQQANLHPVVDFYLADAAGQRFRPLGEHVVGAYTAGAPLFVVLDANSLEDAWRLVATLSNHRGSTSVFSAPVAISVEVADELDPICDFALLNGYADGTVTDDRPGDLGIVEVRLDEGANVSLAVDAFAPGDGVVTYRLSRVNPMLAAWGDVVGLDGAGNSCRSEIRFEEVPCLPSQFTQQVDRVQRRMLLTIIDPEGIVAVRFTDDRDNPALENLIASTTSMMSSVDGIRWFAIDSGDPPTNVDFVLTATASRVRYFAGIENACGTTTLIDPPHDFGDELPLAFGLEQNFPNPFNPQTEIVFHVPEASFVSIVVYDLLGREMSRLVDGSVDAGFHRVSWDGTNHAGRALASGIYLYRMEAGAFVQTRRMTFMK